MLILLGHFEQLIVNLSAVESQLDLIEGLTSLVQLGQTCEFLVSQGDRMLQVLDLSCALTETLSCEGCILFEFEDAFVCTTELLSPNVLV